VLRDPRSLGVRASLDDFGSAFSSLNYVKDLLVDGLKIDKSYIDGLGKDAVNDSIVRLNVDFAHTLGLRITAEGVENERQAKSLADMNCGMVQGFYFSKNATQRSSGKFIATNPAWEVSK
jgi:ammonium transporter, Amt family